jgi:hypothetical protein
MDAIEELLLESCRSTDEENLELTIDGKGVLCLITDGPHLTEGSGPCPFQRTDVVVFMVGI